MNFATGDLSIADLLTRAVPGIVVAIFTLVVRSWWDRRQAALRSAAALLHELEANRSTLEGWLKLVASDQEMANNQEVRANMPPLSTFAIEDALRTAAFAHHPFVRETAQATLNGWKVANVEVEHRRQLRLMANRPDGLRRSWNDRIKQMAEPLLAATPELMELIRGEFGLTAEREARARQRGLKKLATKLALRRMVRRFPFGRIVYSDTTERRLPERD